MYVHRSIAFDEASLRYDAHHSRDPENLRQHSDIRGNRETMTLS